MTTIIKKIEEARQFLVPQSYDALEFSLILRSGLGELAEEIGDAAVIPYERIPSWGKSTVAGRAGQLAYGGLGGHKAITLQGRFHFYEGNPMELVTLPVRVMKALGCKGFIVINAAGGISSGPGTLMAISDHINMTRQDPSIGANLDGFGPRLPDISDAYTAEYHDTAHKVTEKIGIELDKGVYLGVSGPCHETSAEIRAFRTLGAGMVDMSTVPEVTAIAHLGLKVLGISATTDRTTGLQSLLNHEEVVAITQQIKENFKALVKAVLAEL